MCALGRRCLPAALAAMLVVLGLAGGAGVVRLLPWLFAPQVPLAVVEPFARALFGVAVETAALVGPPVGFALASVAFVELGESRALSSLGRSPLQMTLSVAPRAVGVAVVAAGVAVTIGSTPTSPGQFLGEVLDQGKLSCAGESSARKVDVPLAGLTWLCFGASTAPPRVVGPLPGSGGRAWFSATSIEPSGDLRSFVLQDLVIGAPGNDGAPHVQVRAASATVRGLAPWGRPANLSAVSRSLLVCLTGAALAVLAVLGVVRGSETSRLRALLGSVAPPAAALAVLSAVDRVAGAGWQYALVPAAGAATWLVAQKALLGFGAIVARRRVR